MNLTHCNETHVVNILLILVTKLILGIVTFFKDAHWPKQLVRDTQLFNVVGSDTVLSSVHPTKVCAKVVIAIAFDGSSMSRKLVQLANAVCKSVNELADVGITTLYKLLQPLNILDIWDVQVIVAGSFTYSNNPKDAVLVVDNDQK